MFRLTKNSSASGTSISRTTMSCDVSCSAPNDLTALASVPTSARVFVKTALLTSCISIFPNFVISYESSFEVNVVSDPIKHHNPKPDISISSLWDVEDVSHSKANLASPSNCSDKPDHFTHHFFGFYPNKFNQLSSSSSSSSSSRSSSPSSSSRTADKGTKSKSPSTPERSVSNST